MKRILLVPTLSMTLCLPHIVFAQEEADSAEENTLTSITMMSMSLITRHLYTYKPKMTADMILASAGGETYLSAEVFSTGEFKSLDRDLQKIVATISDGKQTEAHADMITSLTDAREILTTKKMLQLDAATSFSSAALSAHQMKEVEVPSSLPEVSFTQKAFSMVMALAYAGDAESKLLQTTEYEKCTKKLASIGEGGMSSPAVNACGLWDAKALRDAAATATQSVVDLVKVRDQVASSQSNKEQADAARAKMEADVGKVVALKDKLQKKSPECAALVNGVKESCTAFGKLVTEHEVFKSSVIKGLFSEIPDQRGQGILDSIFNITVSKAEAGLSPEDFIGGIFSLGDANTTIMMALTPEQAVEFDKLLFSPGKRAKLWESLESRAKKAADATQSEIDKIDINIEKTKMIQVNVLPKYKLESVLDFFIAKVQAETSKKPLTSEVKIPCAAGPGNTFCPSLSKRLRTAAGFSYLPPMFKSVALQITDFADELGGSNTLSPKTIANGEKILAKSAGVNSLLKKYPGAKDKKSEDAIFKRFNDITANVLRKNNTTPARFFASYSGSTLSKTDAASSPVKAAVKRTGISTKATLPEKQAAAAIKRPGEKNYKLNDINQNKDESIFTVISDRYLKSGFSKLFER
jgi:hypothetical protein